MNGPLDTIRTWAKRIKREVITLWFARQHPSTPWHAKALVAIVVAYALSPIDLIPDFIPVLGYVDDLLLLPVLIWLTLRLLPAPVLEESRRRAEAWMAKSSSKPHSVIGAVAILLLWAIAAAALSMWAMGTLRS